MRYLISFLQKEKVTNEVRLGKLKEGKAPSNKEIVDEVLRREKGHGPGKPYYRSMDIRPNSITNSTLWNRTFSNLKKDLDILFEANVQMNDRMIGHQEKGDIENNLLNSKVNLASMKLEEVEEMMERSSGMQNFNENFKDFRFVDSKSTVDINLKEKSVTLEKTNSSRRYDVSKSTFKVTPLTHFTDSEHHGEENSVLNDFFNEFEVYRYVTENNGEFTVQMNVDLESAVSINTIQLSLNSSSKMNGTLYISENGMDFTEHYNVEDNKILEWLFEETLVKSVKIILRKPNADGYSAGLYEHYFIFKNMSLYRNVYEQEGILLGRPVRFSGSVDKIRLQAEDIIFNDTNIIYSVGMQRSDGKTQWTIAENGESADMNLLEQVDEIVNKNDQSYGQSIEEGLYRIYRIPDKTNVDSINIRPGYQMWYRERLENIGGYNYTLSFSSYDSTKIVARDFVDTEEYRTNLSSRNLDVLTQYVDMDEDTSVTFPYAFVEGTPEHFQQILFCNGTKIAQKKGTFTVALKKGLNKIIMFLYLGSGIGEESYSASVTTKVNFREITDDISAFPKMKYVNPYALRKESLMENYLYYTIENSHIIVKHVPDMNVGNYNNEMRYYLSYRFLSENSPYIQYENGTPYVKVRMKATLISGNHDFTPKIMNYRLSSE